MLCKVPRLMNGMQLGLSYIALTTVLFLFPPGRPVTGSSMSKYRLLVFLWWHSSNKIDYCIVAFAIIVIISVVHWVIHGQKHFIGPRHILS